MVQCCAFGCNTRPVNGNKGLFKFPQYPVLRKKWTNAVGRTFDFRPSNVSKVCKNIFMKKALFILHLL